MSDIVERCRKNLCVKNAGCNTNPYCSCADLEDAADRILELEAKLAAAEADAGRYRVIREHVAPIHLVQVGLPDFGDLSGDETIAERIDRIVDAAIDTARGAE